MAKTHSFPVRVYYEDTDAGGVVYYANYLKFAERARTEALRSRGLNQSELDYFFVVRHAEIDLRKPARLDDLLTIETRVAEFGKASFVMEQAIARGKEALVAVTVKIACVGKDFRPKKLPEDLVRLMAGN